MKFLYFLLLLPAFMLAQVPQIKKSPFPYIKHGLTYIDNYSGLEDMHLPEIKTWIEAQNTLYTHHLEEIGTYAAILKKIKEYDAGSGRGLPTKKGRYLYIYGRDKDQRLVLYYLETINSKPQALPYALEGYSKNSYIAAYYPSKNSAYLASKISVDGSDLQEVRFTDIKAGKLLEDVLTNVKYSDIGWKKDEGVFYKKNTNLKAFASDSTYRLYYHVMGSQQKDDKLVYDTSAQKIKFTFWIDGEYLFICHNNADGTKDHYCMPLDNLDAKPVKCIANAGTDFKFINYNKGRIYYSTNKFDWGEVRSCNIDGTDEKIVIPQFYNQLLTDTYFLSGYLVCKYKTLGKYHLSVYDADMNFVRKYELPAGMDTSVRFYEKETSNLYLTISSYTLSPQNYTLNLQTGDFKPFYNDLYKPKPTLFPLDHFESKTITFKSRDNKDIPITIVHKKGLLQDGNNPTLLKAYGGFGKVSDPAYDPALLYFLENGGIFAYAEVRGGGEKGLKWHTAGSRRNKVNSINDFVDAAAFLIAQKYTSPNRLGISGTSHGGLLVTGAIVQRPELFKVAISKMGLTDIPLALFYTIGVYHKNEFGDPEDKDDYTAMLACSPYQNIKKEVNYPTLLFITGVNDDRLPPFQSYKFAAAVQNRPAQTNPVYVHTLQDAGHYGRVSAESNIEDNAGFYSFLLYHLMK